MERIELNQHVVAGLAGNAELRFPGEQFSVRAELHGIRGDGENAVAADLQIAGVGKDNRRAASVPGLAAA